MYECGNSVLVLGHKLSEGLGLGMKEVCVFPAQVLVKGAFRYYVKLIF
jgi:hypothetical protein